MRLYNGKTIKQQVDRRVSSQSETRDAVLWSIDTVSQICRVKIQGSSNLITAHFPRNWKTTPYWLKIGNAVSIRHRSGVRGYVEVVGEGRAIPSPVAGEGPLPDQQPLPDMILTGCRLFATSPPSMNLIATSGTYRISGVVYTFEPTLLSGTAIIMDDPAPMTMGSGTIMSMGSSLYTVALDAAPAAGYYRYDLCCVGADRELDYIAGTPAQTDPVKPLLPAAHVMIGDYILVRGGLTAITDADIGVEWKTPYASNIVLTYDDTHEWSGSDPETTRTIKAEVVDQYGQPLKISGLWQLDKVGGTGTIYSVDTGWHASTVTQAVVNASSYTFTYKRNQSITESSPVFLVTLMIVTRLMRAFSITLLDGSGDPIY
jgi:hypothetical protein